MSAVGYLAFEFTAGLRPYRLAPAFDGDTLPRPGVQMVAACRYGLALGRLTKVVTGDSTQPEGDARLATPADQATAADCAQRAQKALVECRGLVRVHDLPMRLVSASLALDHGNLTFFYTAPCRVDFRGLLRDVVKRFGLPIRLEQVGERDAARLIGGLGRCGRQICCSVWLHDFAAVSLRHARAQGLPTLPSQLSGVCGKLRCCLRYEDTTDETEQVARSPRHEGPLKTATYHWLGESMDPDEH